MCCAQTHPSSQVFADQRHQQAGGGQQRASLRHQLHLHEAHLAVVPGQSQRVHARAHTLQRDNAAKHSGDWRAQTRPSHPDKTRSSKLSASRSDTHLGVASEEAVRDGDVDVKPQRLQDVGLHGDQLLPLVRVVADVEEVVDTGRTALLQGHQNTTWDEL